MKRAFTFIVLAWFAAVVVVVATGCQKKANDATTNASVMDVSGGGYAQARSYTAVEIIGDNYAKSVMYGQPFSIG